MRTEHSAFSYYIQLNVLRKKTPAGPDKIDIIIVKHCLKRCTGFLMCKILLFFPVDGN